MNSFGNQKSPRIPRMGITNSETQRPTILLAMRWVDRPYRLLQKSDKAPVAQRALIS